MSITAEAIRRLAAQGLGLFVRTTSDNLVNANVTHFVVSGLQQLCADNEKFQYWSCYRPNGNSVPQDQYLWRLINLTGLASANGSLVLGEIGIVTGFPHQIDAGETLDFYGVLSLDEWNFARDAALQDKFYKTRALIPLVLGNKEYLLGANQAYSPLITLTANIDNATSTITWNVTTADTTKWFPLNPGDIIQIDTEQMFVVSTNPTNPLTNPVSITVNRAQANTFAAAHNAGAAINRVGAGLTALREKNQIMRMRYRNSQYYMDGGMPEDEVPVVYPYETDYNTVNLVFPVTTPTWADTLLVEYRAYYGAAANDATTYTLPDRLAIEATKWHALKLIFQKLGPMAKKTYGQQMVLTERDLMESEQRWLDTDVHRDWSDEVNPAGGDIQQFTGWSW